MMNLYITADQIGSQSGGGIVTYYESEALKSINPNCMIYGRNAPQGKAEVGKSLTCPIEADWSDDPWGADSWMKTYSAARLVIDSIAHFYAGTFTQTINHLKTRGVKISYTAAAHSIEISKREHLNLGIPYDYPHLTDPELWKRYVGGYLAADVLICPSQHSAQVMRGFGYQGRVEIIPHGCHLPEKVGSFPSRFTVGYLGAIGPDKGLIYLLQAWRKLNYKDADLIIAGRDSVSPFLYRLVGQYGGGSIRSMGWVNKIEDFYNQISCYCQPSVTEGFGIEVLEAMSYGRPVICSRGAGAADIVGLGGVTFNACDVDKLAEQINLYKNNYAFAKADGEAGRKIAETLTWDKIREKYKELWRGML